jgi:hypothetical protein
MSEPTPITGEIVEAPAVTPPPEDGVVVRNPNGWSLVQHGGWEVSIGPDGMIMLPHHLAPAELEDFVAAVTLAAELSVELQAESAAAVPDPGLGSTLVIQESGQALPPGAFQLVPNAGSAIPVNSTPRLDLADPTAQ